MTNTLTLRADQTESLRKLVRYYSINGDLLGSVKRLQAELESSVKSNQYAVEQFPGNEDLKTSLAINEAYLAFIKTAPLSFFK